jgi:AraC-like DNA-binding protein
MLYLGGIAITFFLVFILLSKNNKSKADVILTFWLLLTGLHLLLYYIYVTKKYVSFPYLLGLEIPLPLVHGPFLFLYTSALTNQRGSKKINALHFIPFTLALLSLLPFFLLSSIQKIKVYQQEGKEYELLVSIIFGVIVVSGIFYTVLSLQKLAKHRRVIPDQFSFTEKINLSWLFYLILGSCIIWLLVIFTDDKYIFSGVVLYIVFIGYFGIKQVGIFTNKEPQIQNEITESLPVEVAGILNNTLPEEQEIKAQPEKTKYEKSKISAADISAIHKKLLEVMQTEKFYTNSELTLSELSQKINVHPNILSQVINSVEQKNFYDYINLQRIEEFKRLISLSENQKFTLLSLAFECGFNSKTSFNRNFKKVTNLSPSEYLKQANINLALEL